MLPTLQGLLPQRLLPRAPPFMSHVKGHLVGPAQGEAGAMEPFSTPSWARCAAFCGMGWQQVDRSAACQSAWALAPPCLAPHRGTPGLQPAASEYVHNLCPEDQDDSRKLFRVLSYQAAWLEDRAHPPGSGNPGIRRPLSCWLAMCPLGKFFRL